MFTTHNKKIEAMVQEKAGIVTKIIVQELNPLSVLMFGSFGKGEGTILNRKDLFNDFDIYIITERKIPDSELDRVGKKASAAIGMGGGEFIETDGTGYQRKKFFHVDLRAILLKDLPKLKPTTRTYEIKHSTQLLHGKDYRDIIDISEKDLPLSEGWRHMINKSCLLLLAMDEQRLKGKFRKDEKLIAIYYALKTFMACAEALLLLRKRFSGTYRGRAALFKKAYGKEMPKLARQVEFATKIKCDFQPAKIKDAVEFWKAARDAMYFTIRYMAQSDLKIFSTSKEELMRGIYKKLPLKYHVPYLSIGKAAVPLQYGLTGLYFLRTKYSRALLKWRDVGVRVFMPAFLLLYAPEEPWLLKEAKHYLHYLAPVQGKDFSALRNATLYCYGKYYTQRLL
ncbi:MAG TPA: hypothetical protein VJJ75_00820 [Candidatus Nanoarchaeia archaeon]|nr:hypothetical protein [Candidatus Nanoarchaeia archaeon]